MRILHVVHQYLPDHMGGTELYTQMVARGQAAAGHKVAIFTPVDRIGHSIVPETEDGVTIYRVPTGPRSAAAVFRSTFYNPQLVRAFAGVFAAERPDVVHLQHLMGLPVAMLDVVTGNGVPHVISLHDYWYPCANGQLLTNYDDTLCDGPDATWHNCGRCAVARAGWTGSIGPASALAPLMRLRARLLQGIYDGAALVIAPTPFVGQVYENSGFDSTCLVVNPKGLDRPPHGDELLAEQNKPQQDGRLHIGYLGNLSQQKGVHTLLDAVAKLPAGKVRATIYGDLGAMPDYVAELQRRVEGNNIHFAGPLERQEVWAALAQLDLLVVPSLWYEAAPTTIREAFAVGLPVVASDLGTMPDLVKDGVNGLLFPPGDSVALAALLEDLIAHPDHLQRLNQGVVPDRPMAEHVSEMTALVATAVRGFGDQNH